MSKSASDERSQVMSEIRAALAETAAGTAESQATKSPGDHALTGISDETGIAFVERYFTGVATADLAAQAPSDLAAAARHHLQLAGVRAPGSAVSAVRTGTRPIIDVVTPDHPYLVDSIAIVLARLGVGVDLLVHPIEHVRRDASGRLAAFAAPDSADAIAEAWIHFELSKIPAGTTPEAIDRQIMSVLADVAAIDEDASALRQRAREIAAELRKRPVPAASAGVGDPAAFIDWLADGSFVFLGYRAYRFDRPATAAQPDADTLIRAVDGSGLGVLRDTLRPSRDKRLGDLGPDRRRRIVEPDALIFTKDPDRSSVVRADYLEYLGVKMLDADGHMIGEHRFLGLFDTHLYRRSVFDIAPLRAKADAVLEASGWSTSEYNGRELVDTLEVFPRDELFQIPLEDLKRITIEISGMQERKQVRLLTHRDRFGRFVSCLVYVPRDQFSTTIADEIVETLREAYGGVSTEHDNRVTERILARVHVLIRLGEDAPAEVDETRLEKRLAELTRSWEDDVRAAAGATPGADPAVFPPGYRAYHRPDDAAADLARVASLGEHRPLLAHLDGDTDALRLSLYARGVTLDLSSLLPVLEHLGLRALHERSYRLATEPPTWIHDVAVTPSTGSEGLADPARREELEHAFARAWNGELESDGLNSLVAAAGLSTRQITILRAYVRYLRQIGLPFTPTYVEQAFRSNPEIAGALAALFDARHAPTDDPAGADERADGLAATVTALLDGVASLEHDRILRSVLTVMLATVRTNAFRSDVAPHAPCSGALSFKLDPHRIPDLPLPRPLHEIWVYAPHVEGVHLRGGAIARGGLRHSDRREDFRTEVLGLMKAQMVKNAVIVPVGAKGGFFVKSPPKDLADRRAEVVRCYQDFVAALLDVTDNLTLDEATGNVLGRNVAPAGVRCHDAPDPYLVVAADKGTATFSDIANGVSARYGFWLGDAFASGGSVGYDHKAMGITARGAWESVRRHLRSLGLDADRDPLTVVGVGDMSGDVFGNGMLLSTQIRVVAAFDHRHVFIDPSPVAASAYTERRRLFDKPGSSWDDYDRSLISAGGGVWPRSAKQIPLSPEAQVVLGTDADALTPDQLISTILRAPVDLLWNGGIGTYVKASSQANAEVGDRANDAVRINGGELRCRVVGEGGNLGFTQLGRIEYALTGGLINTDAIDNSAGVDCSDHEVNIKIALSATGADGDPAARAALLASMTDDVGDLVLEDNRAQTLALSIARTQALIMVDAHRRQIAEMERAGELDRAIEFLPGDEELQRRRAEGTGLTAPEFAVLLAYTKDTTTAAVLETDLPDAPWLGTELREYFPKALQKAHGDAIDKHPLRREIIATRVVNDMVNHTGVSFLQRIAEQTSARRADIVRAHIVAREVFSLRRDWAAIDALPVGVFATEQASLLLDLRAVTERGVLWLLHHRRSPIDLRATIDQFATGVATLAFAFPDLLTGIFGARVRARAESLGALGLEPELARRAASWPYLHTSLDIVELARANVVAPEVAAAMYWSIFERLELTWLWEQISELPRWDRWRTQARSALRDDLLANIRVLAADALASPGGLDGWLTRNGASIKRATAVFDELRAQADPDVATLTVALRQVRNVALSSTS